MAYYVDTASRQPIYQQLAGQIREAVARGDLRPEAKLPSVRQMSGDLVVNPNTVAKAYTELERDGIVVSRPGLGIFIAQPKNELTKAARDRRLTELLDKALTEAVHLGYAADDVIQLTTRRVQEFQWNAK